VISDLYLSVKLGKVGGEDFKQLVRLVSVAEVQGYLKAVEEVLKVLNAVKEVGEGVETAASLVTELYSWASDKLATLYSEDVEPLTLRLKK